MDENNLQESLQMYKLQLTQVEQTIQAAGETDDLVKLKADLSELVKLTHDSLLSLKKSLLLRSLDDSHGDSPVQNTTPSVPDQSDTDAEFAAFKAAIGDDISTDSFANAHSVISGEDNSASQPDEQLTSIHAPADFDEIIGSKCRAPYTQEWGTMEYHNALVLSVDPILSPPALPMVRVMFCNPTHLSMLPCQYFLDGSCKFSDKDCRFSHGYPVCVDELQEFLDPDYSLLCVDSACLAKYTDGIWYRSKVTKVMDDHKYRVKYETYNETTELDIEDMVPLEDVVREGSSDDDGERVTLERDDSDIDDDDLPVFLWKPPKTTHAMGEWESHTRGIGSKLMAKMGYVVGQGLGKDGEGRAEPVPIQLLPQGKSLDKIMELKAIAGDRELYDVMKQQEKKKRKQEKKDEKSYKSTSFLSTNVFDFINKRLGGKKGRVGDLVSPSSSSSAVQKNTRQISESDLHKKSDRHLNIQLLKTSEEMRKTEKELVRLKQSLTRNQSRDKRATNSIRQKISSLEQYLNKLKSSEQTMELHQKKRSDHKKLTIF